MAPAKKNEKSGVGEDFAEIRGYIADIRKSIAGIHEKLGLLDLIAQKVLGEDAGKKGEDVKKQQEQEMLGYEDLNQIVSHLEEYPSNIDPIVDQIQRSPEEKKPTEEEIQTSKETQSVVGESRKGVDQILCLDQRVTTTEATSVAKEEEPREHNHKPKKKKKRKRWKKCLLKIWKFLVVNRRSRKKENISLSYVNEWSGFYSIKMKVTLQVEKEKQRKAKSDGYAYHVLDIMLMRRKLVTKKSKRKKKKVTNKKKKRTRRMEYMGVKHFSVEGQFEYKAVLFVPKGAPFDPFDTGKKPNNIKLDVCRFFIIDNSEETICEHLSFVKGMVYSEELPLNISKETLKQNKLIRKNYGKKCSELFLEIAETKEDYHWLVENPEFDRGLLLMFKKGRNKTKMGCAGKGLKHKKKMYKRLYGKLLWKYRSDMKQLVTWKGWRFKPKHYMSKENIKERLSGNQIVCLWNYNLGHELFRKIFSQWWCKKKRGCVRAYWRFSNNLVYSPLKLTLELKFHRIILKATMKHKRTILQEECLVLILSKISYNSISIEMIICMGILKERTADVLLLGLDSSYEMLRLQWLETWKDLGVKLEEPEDENEETEEIKERIEGMCKVVNDVLEDKVEVVIVFDRVVDSPCYIVTCDYRWTADVKRNVKAQALGDSSMSSCMTNKKTMEINLENLIMGELRKRADAHNSNKYVEDLAFLLFETALLTSDLSYDDSNTLGSRIRRLFKHGLNINAEQMGTRRVQMLQPVKQLSELCVPTVPAAIQGEETCTKADMGQEHHGFNKAWQTGREDSILAPDALLQLLLRPTMDCCSSYYVLPIWTALGSGKAAWRISFLSMTLRTRSISMAPVMISVPKEEEGPMDTSPRRKDL